MNGPTVLALVGVLFLLFDRDRPSCFRLAVLTSGARRSLGQAPTPWCSRM